MIAIQDKILGMIERCGHPFILRMALATITGNLLVQRVRGGFMAALALITHIRLQQYVIEMSFRFKSLNSGMIYMTSQTVLRYQFLMKRR